MLTSCGGAPTRSHQGLRNLTYSRNGLSQVTLGRVPPVTVEANPEISWCLEHLGWQQDKARLTDVPPMDQAAPCKYSSPVGNWSRAPLRDVRVSQLAGVVPWCRYRPGEETGSILMIKCSKYRFGLFMHQPTYNFKN